jgi:hypothetical protein
LKALAAKDEIKVPVHELELMYGAQLNATIEKEIEEVE